MASKTSIGAVIGLEGARQYNTDMKNIIANTKLLKAEYKELTTTFNKDKSKWSDVTESAKKLGEQAQNVANKLAIQSEALKKMQESGKGAKQTWDEYYQALAKQAEAVNKTQAEYNELMRTIEQLPSKLEFAASKLDKISSGLKPLGDFMTKTVTLPITAALTGAVKAAIDWESAFIGVKKTNEETIDSNGNVTYSYEQLEAALQQLGGETASSLQNIAETAEIVGQMGISTDQVAEFTKYMIAMGDATNLSSSEAASYMATLLNIMNKGMPIAAEQARHLGDAIVYLGNNYNTTEADIAHMAARLAPGAKLVKMTEADVLGLATAMSEAKITAEGGGTAMTQILQNIQKNFALFSKGAESKLPQIARVANMSADQFAQAWGDEPIKALEAFIHGLGKLDEEGEYTSMVLDELDMAGIRQNLTLSALSLTSERLSSAISDANREFTDGNALLKEAENVWKSSAGQIQQFKNSLTILGNSFGKEILPYITDFVDKLSGLMVEFSKLPSSAKQNIIKFVGALALIGPGIKIFTGITDGVSKVMTSLDKLNKMGGLKIFTKDIDTATKATGTLANTIGTKLLPVLTSDAGLIGLIGIGLGGAYAFAYSEATKLDQEFRNNAEAAEYAAKRYHWTEEKVNELGYTWTENGNLIKLANDGISENVKQFSEGIKEDLIDLKEGVKGNLTEISDIAKYNFDVMKTSLTESSQEAKKNVKVEFDTMSNDIILTTDNLGKKVPEKYRNMASSLKTEGQVINRDFKMVMTGIEKEASSINLYTSGQHLMDSLKNGMQSAYSRVYNAAVSVARGIRNVLMFSVPKEGPLSDFDKAMPDMMELMAKGINDNAYLVEDAIANVAGGMRNEATNQSFNYGGVVINLTAPEGADGRMLVEEIENELAARTMRRKAVFG